MAKKKSTSTGTKKVTSQLRGKNGQFISVFKSNIIKEIAEKQGSSDAQEFLKENFDAFAGFVKNDKTEYSFNENTMNYAFSKKRSININGEKMSTGMAMMKVQEVSTFLKTKFGAVMIQFNGFLKNEKKAQDKKGKKAENWNEIELSLPDIKKLKKLLKETDKGELTIEELIDELHDMGIDVIISDPKKQK